MEDMFLSVLRAIYLFFVDTLQTLLLAASVFLVIYIFIARPFQVTGESMFPTYKNGEYVLTNLIGMKLNAPQHGDVIVFKAPIDAEKDFIKRVVGVPGDRIMLRGGAVYRNGVILDESKYLGPQVRTYAGAFLQDDKEITVPDGNYFVMGDNRPFSSDSREWGYLTRGAVIGSSLFVYWPPKNMRLIKNPYK
jgi:signal peptidase I